MMKVFRLATATQFKTVVIRSSVVGTFDFGTTNSCVAVLKGKHAAYFNDSKLQATNYANRITGFRILNVVIQPTRFYAANSETDKDEGNVVTFSIKELLLSMDKKIEKLFDKISDLESKFSKLDKKFTKVSFGLATLSSIVLLMVAYLLNVFGKQPNKAINFDEAIGAAFQAGMQVTTTHERGTQKEQQAQMVVINNFNVETLLPAIIAISYYAFVFFFAEITRKLVGLIFKKSSLIYIMLIELIGTAQMCTCVYENSIIVKHYGPIAFFFTVSSLLLTGSLLNRGAFVNPLPVIEQFFTGKIGSDHFLSLLFAQTIGGYSAFRLANSLWYYSLSYSTDHLQLFERLPCTISYKVPFNYVFINELLCTFILRFAIHRMPYILKTRLLPFIISGFLTFSLVYVGIPGLNPVIASSRLMGCSGLDLQWFMIIYWFCPVIGWMFAVKFDNVRIAKKKQNRKKDK